MFKKWGLSAAAMLFAAAVILPGCGNKQEPKEALQGAAVKAAAMTSYEMKSKLVINNLTIDTPTEQSSATMTTQVLSMLKNAEITVDGVYQADPMQTELTLVLNLKGDMAMSFTVPMVMTAEKLYVKIPSIPFLPIPENIVGKYVMLDLKKLAEQEGAEFNPGMLDTQKTQKLSNEILSALLAEYDESKYFKDINAKDANLPEGVDAKQVIQFQITNDNVKEATTIFVNNALPKILDILSKEEYKNTLQIDQKQLDEAKAALQNSEKKAEFDKELAKLDQYLTINQFHFNTAINKDDFPVYQDLTMDVNVNNPDDGTKVGLSLTGSNQYSKINEKPVFKIGIPQGGDVITEEELQQQFSTLGSN
ncbi:hypothetical protein SAMN04487895_12927 [Paenibacillus sophorae]|uniref:Lipoprotein n=1 Tax=Paenibacillus sophorae TaxID=1333845 RepID=A0A1H8VYY9_9BACL|nr:hypothetical protein [Paenibacillus sophorae]QWU16375.1 hypothetical protein KP014_03695 [Paenibacillus sophorae]SEP20642.1 hypothetical protein SAMN04487895_12927 [Paenibacillus sophorae]